MREIFKNKAKQEQFVRVVVLPCDKSNIIRTSNGTLVHQLEPMLVEGEEFVNLYFLSNEKVTRNDHIFYKDRISSMSYHENVGLHFYHDRDTYHGIVYSSAKKDKFHKVVASTDSNLSSFIYPVTEDVIIRNHYTPTDSFLDYYCENPSEYVLLRHVIEDKKPYPKRRMRFEARVINPLLNIIKNNIDYLTKPENLDQLSKLGFMYEILFLSGRMCYGYEYSDYKPLIKSENQCEDNPKYKLDRCDVGTDEQFDLIYDAWAMHVTNDLHTYDYMGFYNLITKGKEYSSLEKLQMKPQKTMDDWVEIKMHPYYRYNLLFPTRESVVDYLLVTYGTGYKYNKGYVIESAGGADQDKDIYGAWENAKFTKNIKRSVNKILNDDGVALVLDACYKYKMNKEAKKKAQEEAERLERRKFYYDILLEKARNDEDTLKRFRYQKKEDKKGVLTFNEGRFLQSIDRAVDQFIYETENRLKNSGMDRSSRIKYHLCNSSIVTMFSEETHPSYLLEGIKIYENIIKNEKDYVDDRFKIKYDDTDELLVDYAKRGLKRLKMFYDKNKMFSK